MVLMATVRIGVQGLVRFYDIFVILQGIDKHFNNIINGDFFSFVILIIIRVVNCTVQGWIVTSIRVFLRSVSTESVVLRSNVF